MEIVKLNIDAFHLSEEEFFDFCRNNSLYQIERDSNRNIFIMEPSGFESDNVASEISRKVGNWNEENESGKVVSSSAGFVLKTSAIRSPDAAWISKKILNTIPKEMQKKFLHACPEFIVEVKSPSDSLEQLKEKMVEWLENGCELGWLVVPEDEITFIYKKSRVVKVSTFSETLNGEDVLVGFELNLEKLFKR